MIVYLKNIPAREWIHALEREGFSLHAKVRVLTTPISTQTAEESLSSTIS